MPIFEYRCKECGARFEKLIRRETDVESLACPSCGQRDLSKELSTFAAHANASPSAPQPGPCGQMCSTPGRCGLN
ncbi:MAG TPA: zinc ribbon domain-containing protein [Bryobacteraceae bacterium]|nr:zinc ribbon domain-containing protein [Bryobacteraceae bacterium]HPT28296.1 zinc ribbon domain-containing protein [Bryobacteraceae bacterium]